MGDEFGLIVFNSTQLAMKTQKLLEEQHLKTRLLTTPGNLRAGCGLSVFFEFAQLANVKRILTNEQITEKELYYAKKVGLKTHYTKVST